jgi:uncharacterized membrane protein SirB2
MTKTAWPKSSMGMAPLRFATEGMCENYNRHAAPERKYMNIALNIVGVLLVVLGGIWFLQGINLLPGSFMTGETRWAVYGGIAVAVGIALLLTASRRRRNS